MKYFVIYYNTKEIKCIYCIAKIGIVAVHKNVAILFAIIIMLIRE